MKKTLFFIVIGSLFSLSLSASDEQIKKIRQDLYTACKQGNVESVKSILENNNIGKKNNIKIRDVIVRSEGSYCNPYVSALKCKNNLAIIKLFFEKGFWVDSEFKFEQVWDKCWNYTPILYAIKYNKFDVVKYLVEKKADLSQHDDFGYSALHIASMNNHLNIVKYLVEKCEVDIAIRAGRYSQRRRGATNQTPFHVAVQKNNSKIVSYLLDKAREKGILWNYINMKDRSDRTPLYYAVKNGNLNLIKYLVAEISKAEKLTNTHKNKTKNSINVKNSEDKTPLYFAIENYGDDKENYFKIIKFLIAHGASLELKGVQSGGTALHYAARKGDLALFTYLLNVMVEKAKKEKNVNLLGRFINERNNYGFTVFADLIHLGKNDMAQYLIDFVRSCDQMPYGLAFNTRIGKKGNKELPQDLALKEGHRSTYNLIRQNQKKLILSKVKNIKNLFLKLKSQ